MATCAIEDSLTPMYCQTTNKIIRIESSSLEKVNQQCQFNIHCRYFRMDSTTFMNTDELTRKRRFNRSLTDNCKNDLTRALSGDSCSTQDVAKHNNKETFTIRTRPTTLLLTDSAINHPIPPLRTCLSHPSTSLNPAIVIDDSNELSPTKFRSLPVLTSPPTKRLRPQTLFLPSKPTSVTNSQRPISSSFSSILNFIDSSELAEILENKSHNLIFDCGSPLRYRESKIYDANLLHVADKISRKRLKSNPTKYPSIDKDQLNQCDFIILYDDHNDNHRELSLGLKCACEEIQHCLTTKNARICILKSSFSHFLNLYPNLCESFQSCKSSLDESTSPSMAISLDTDFQKYPMTHIIDGVFIGSESNAKNIEELSAEQIRHIINVTSHVPLYHLEQFRYFQIPADDTQKQNLLDYFDQAYKFIYDAIKNNEKVLVHCVAGVSRSPAIVIGFLMRYAHMNMNDAYEFVKNKRSIVSPNLNFMGQLLQYEKQLKEQN